MILKHYLAHIYVIYILSGVPRTGWGKSTQYFLKQVKGSQNLVRITPGVTSYVLLISWNQNSAKKDSAQAGTSKKKPVIQNTFRFSGKSQLASPAIILSSRHPCILCTVVYITYLCMYYVPFNFFTALIITVIIYIYLFVTFP